MNYNYFYSKVARNYNFSRLDEGEVFKSTLNYITTHLHSKHLFILDIGCGTGEYGFALRKKGYKVLGIDKSFNQIEIASKRITAIQGDVLSLMQIDNSVDVVLMIMMIHQLDDSELNVALAEVARVLKPGGILIIKTCFEEEIENRITSRYFPTCLQFDRNRFPSMKRLVSANSNLVLCSYDKMSISTCISKEELIRKFKFRGASNIGMLSNDELERGIIRILEDYSNSNMIKLNFDNSFLIFECCKTNLR